jgi:pyruvate/2-oxoglutarate dehydrogenase complex dihydrolipoamide acyltransferase (E2) component
LGAPQKEALVVDDRVVVGNTVGLHFTIDHRFMDGARGAVLKKSVITKSYFLILDF